MPIPASDIVSSNPGVLSAGGNPLALNGVILSQSLRLPTNAVQSFGSKDAVSAYFGPSSDEYAMAQIYFLGFDNSTIKPGALLFAPYAAANRAAWLRSGSFAAWSLTQLQALSGVLTVTVDGVAFTSSSINLATATSFSDAATKIAAGFTGVGAPTCTWDAITSTFQLNSTTTGALSTITYATGTLSAGLQFTQATGAVLSQGVVADTPATCMAMVISKTQNWADFTTVWEPLLADKENFAIWTNAQNQRYAYMAWDTDAQSVVNGSTTCFGAVVKSLAYDGTAVFGADPAQAILENTTTAILARNCAAFALGVTASIDFSRRNGRITYKFRSQSGFVPTCTDKAVADILTANGYNYYGTWATANDQFSGLAEGSMAGKWSWIDTYINQIQLNSQLQLANMTLLFNSTSVPYNQEGYSSVRAAFTDPIQQGLNFGSIRAGISLSALQKSEINSAAGLDVASNIEQQGYYLQILDPGAQARGQRASPIINFWYTDGGAIHKISFASIDVM